MAEYNKQPRRKFCQFCKDGTDYIDYKDTAMLRKFVTDRGKIKPRREMGLMPYVVAAVSGRGDRRNR